jgi:hypothetical protein
VLPVLGDEGLEKFSYFFELFKNPKLETYRSDPANVKIFAGLVLKNRLLKGAQVRKLPALLDSPKAYRALRTSGYDRAMEVLGLEDPAAGVPLFGRIARLAKDLREMPALMVERLRKQRNARRLIKELIDAASVVSEQMSARGKA